MKKILDTIFRFGVSLNETKRNETKRNETNNNMLKNGRRCSYLVIAPSMLERRVKA